MNDTLMMSVTPASTGGKGFSTDADSPIYTSLGASSGKKELHDVLNEKNFTKAALENPRNASQARPFCSVWPDPFDKGSQHVYLLHADGAGTKSALAYIYWKETGDLSVWQGIAEDALVMNTDDVLCAGAVDVPFLFSSNIVRNRQYIPAAVIAALIAGTQAVISKFNTPAWGCKAQLCGGETADMGDVVRTVVVDATLMTRMPKQHVIDNSRIGPGDVIVGLASDGTTKYDQGYNSGIGSNGLTLARHLLLRQDYAERYPESYDQANLAQGVAYRGSCDLQDKLPGTSLTVGQALLSPTRSYLPVMREVLKKYRSDIHGLVHCTGSGNTKLLCGQNVKLLFEKDNLFTPPPIFRLIKEKSDISWREMYRVFNMGHRLEIYAAAEKAEQIIAEAHACGVKAQIVGRVKELPKPATHAQVKLLTPDGDWETYSAE